MSPRTVDRAARRAQLVAAAASVFAERGVVNTSVADIVRGAGVAQGTFYLYFDTKDDVLVAVVEEVADRLLAGLAANFDRPGANPAQRLLGLADALAALTEDRALADLAEFIHRPENQRLHDRFAEQLLPRLAPLVEQLIVDGVAEGSFRVADPRTAAWFVLGGLRGLELAGTPVAAMPGALDVAVGLALRALGHQEEQ